MREIRILEVKSELGAGTRGSSLGSDAIKIAALDVGSRYFKQHKITEVPNENHLLLESSGSAHAKRISGVLTMTERIADEVCKTLQNKEFPVLLSGDHSCSAGTVSGIRKAFPKLKVGVIWVDAHSDIHSPYTTPSGNMHGMPIAVLLDEDNLDCRVNKPDQETLNYWYQLKNIGNIAPKIGYADLVYIALRDYEKEEKYLLEKNKVKIFRVADIREEGAGKIADDALKYLSHCDLIYISFDVDSLDPSHLKGTGTPVPGGMTIREAGDLVSRLVGNEKVCCFEISEVNPTLDKDNLMSENAFEILQRASDAIVNA
ncbi:MAG: arginase [Daejeonella sp.]